MKIALLVPSLAPKGPVLVARELACGLVDLGHEVSVFYLSDKFGVDFPCSVEKFGYSSIRKIRRSDVVHSHSLRPDFVAWVFRRIFRFDPVFVSTVHNYVEIDLCHAYGKLASAVFSKVWRFLWAGLTGCVVLTEDARRYYAKSQPRLRSCVIYNGRGEHFPAPINETDLAAIRVLKSRYRIIGSSAVITHRKGLDQVIKALPYLKDYAFVLIGSGPDVEALTIMARALGVEERFVALGFRDNARDYLPHFDVYAMPSHSEGMPLAMLEATCAGVPVVCSSISVFREIFTELEVGFFALNDTMDLIAAIRRVEAEPHTFAAMAKAKFDLRYSTGAMVVSYLKFYRDLMAERCAGAG